MASFFVSRVDTEVDRRLDAIGTPEALALRGKAAVAQAKLAYQLFRERFSGERWEALAAKGARVQRPLWASTSTKNPAYPDLLYVDTLIGPDTVNTLPDATIEAFVDHGVVARTIDEGVDRGRPRCSKRSTGSASTWTTSPTHSRTRASPSFVKSFDELLHRSTDKANALTRSERAVRQRAGDRLQRRDTTLWPEGNVAANRLGWLDVPSACGPRRPSCRHGPTASTPTTIVLLGMGGSSLGPEVLRAAVGSERLVVLDTTDPADGRVQSPIGRRSFFSSRRSRGRRSRSTRCSPTCWDRVPDGSRYAAITDPGTALAARCAERGFDRDLREPTRTSAVATRCSRTSASCPPP